MESVLRTRRVAVAVAALLLIATSAPVEAGNIASAYAVARFPNGPQSYIPGSKDRYNSFTGGDVTVTRFGKGLYAVRFENNAYAGGIVLVSPLGSAPRMCTVSSWGPDGDDELAEIRCWNYSGNLADSRFALNFIHGLTGYGPLAYFWLYDESASYDLSGNYNFNSEGGTNHVQHTSTGHYHITLGDLGGANGNVQVSTYGSLAICRPSQWGGAFTTSQGIDVNCRTRSGSFVDHSFNLVFVNHSGLRGLAFKAENAGYVWADHPNAASYLPSANWNWNGQFHENTVKRNGPGNYVMKLTGVSAHGGSAHVSPYGKTQQRCQLGSISKQGAVEKVGVLCFKPDGTPTNSKYSAIYSR